MEQAVIGFSIFSSPSQVLQHLRDSAVLEEVMVGQIVSDLPTPSGSCKLEHERAE